MDYYGTLNRSDDMSSDDLVLSIENLSVVYGKRPILKNVNLQVRVGDFWFFLGPNGVGKTTLLRAVLGLLSPAEGQIFMNPEYAGRELIGFVPQRCDLNPTLSTTVSEFVLLGLAGLRTHSKERPERLLWALERMNLADLKEKDYWSLSGGQRQRALVARALIRKPKFLIADEPTKDLDLTATRALMDSLNDLNRKERLTVLFVTHDLTLAAKYCTHTALFLNGRVQTGACQTVLNSEDLQEAYGIPVSVYQEPSGVLHVHINGVGELP
jgi:ABC-type Mn2+/Zn2+ transport system ATPase subunit